jgi:hypothetical protein
LQALSARGDPLEAIDHLVPWESFRAEIEAVVLTPDELKKSSCKRRSNNPSLNRPGFRSRRSKNPAADSLFALSRQRAGDEERGRLFEGSACGSH